MDDDPTIHNIWETRFSNPFSVNKDLKIHHFYKISHFKSWLHYEMENSTNNLLNLIDYEIIGERENGLNLINYLKISKNSILVTSRFEDPSIRKICKDSSIKMIPKSIAGIIPIVFNDTKEEINHELSRNSKYYDVVHVDDDHLIRNGWELSAKINNINFISISKFDDLAEIKGNLSLKTKFYIDNDLGKGNLQGDQVAQILYEQGFREIFLSTGYEPEFFENYQWVRGVIGKIPPWEKKSLS